MLTGMTKSSVVQPDLFFVAPFNITNRPMQQQGKKLLNALCLMMNLQENLNNHKFAKADSHKVNWVLHPQKLQYFSQITRCQCRRLFVQCGPGHTCEHTAKRMWLHVHQTVSEYGQNDGISRCIGGALGAFTSVLRAVHLWLDHPEQMFIPGVHSFTHTCPQPLTLLSLYQSQGFLSPHWARW